MPQPLITAEQATAPTESTPTDEALKESQVLQASQVSEGKAAAAAEEEAAVAAAAKEQAVAATEEEVAAASEERAAAAAKLEATEEEAAAASEERAAAAAGKPAASQEAPTPEQSKVPMEPSVATSAQTFDLALRTKADLSVSKWDVDTLNGMMTLPDFEQHTHVDGISVGADLTQDLTWLIVGCCTRTCQWQPLQLLPYKLPARASFPTMWALQRPPQRVHSVPTCVSRPSFCKMRLRRFMYCGLCCRSSWKWRSGRCRKRCRWCGLSTCGRLSC